MYIIRLSAEQRATTNPTGLSLIGLWSEFWCLGCQAYSRKISSQELLLSRRGQTTAVALIEPVVVQTPWATSLHPPRVRVRCRYVSLLTSCPENCYQKPR